MKQVKWGKALFAFLLSFAMLCTVIPEVSYAAVPAEEEDMAIDEVAEKEKEETGESVKKEKNGEAIDSTGRVDWEDISTGDLENAVEIQDDQVQSVHIEEEGAYQVFKFIPTETKEYTFFGISSYDTYGILKSADNSLFIEDDDGADNGSDFFITAELTKGKTYYCVVQMYSSSQTGSFLCMISSSRKSYILEAGDVDKFEILRPAKDTWFESDATTIWSTDVPMNGLKYRITCEDGNVIEETLDL